MHCRAAALIAFSFFFALFGRDRIAPARQALSHIPHGRRGDAGFLGDRAQ
jgi:hypothetical protein